MCFILQKKPAKSTVKVSLKHGPRRSLGKLRKILTASKYRSDLRQVSNAHKISEFVKIERKSKVFVMNIILLPTKISDCIEETISISS